MLRLSDQATSVGADDQLLIEVQAVSMSPGALAVLERVREVLRLVLAAGEGEWPDLAEWRVTLPQWFLSACAEEETPENAEKWLAWWRTLDPDARAQAARDRPWSLTDWLHWLYPPERQWFWWGASTNGDDLITITVVVNGWPAPLGALEWLLKAAGASTVVTSDRGSA